MSYYISDHGKDCTCWTYNFGRNKEFFELIHNQKARIAELEAEVERLKPQDEMTYPEALKALNEMADFIKQQSATDFEEGEG